MPNNLLILLLPTPHAQKKSRRSYSGGSFFESLEIRSVRQVQSEFESVVSFLQDRKELFLFLEKHTLIITLAPVGNENKILCRLYYDATLPVSIYYHPSFYQWIYR